MKGDTAELNKKVTTLFDKVYEIDKRVELLEEEEMVEIVEMVVSDVKYDNELLNHSYLTKDAVKEIGWNEFLNKSEQFSSELVSEIISTGYNQLLLAGLESIEEGM